MSYSIPIDGERDELGIYIDHTIPTMSIQDQMKAIEKYMEKTNILKVSFIREGETDCIMMCPDDLTKGVQWKIGKDLETTKKHINVFRNHFNSLGKQHEIIAYNTQSCQKCGKTDNLKKCGRCHNVFYCNVECQRSDWKYHKNNCKKI